ncbi:hypothetical protein [Nocardia harenae]|uniref:hypothetical protein n=1 Tax=Nocardia harenae TaxID=358707 RepID=UPI00082B464E|nr:hypothetical protein [Nocardia harenae]
MSDDEEPDTGRRGMRDQLRRRLDGIKPARDDDGSSNVVRLPRRPRRVPEEPGGQHPRPWRQENSRPGDPPPTRPVTRSELQAETGAWSPAPPAAEPGEGERDAQIVEFGARRRRRPNAPRMARPRRIEKRDDDLPPAE